MKNKKVLTIVLSVILICVIAIGGTAAYLFSRTDDKVNVFTFADNIKGKLDEPNWDPEEGKNLIPGKKVEKDPQITNISVNGVEEYAAIKLTFQNGAGEILTDAETATLLSYIDIDWSANWTRINGNATSKEQIYLFNKVLPQNITSDPVFYSVTIKKNVTTEQLLWLAGDYGHNEDCYKFGTHDNEDCTIIYRHDEKCSVNPEKADESQKDENGCDCTPAVVHENTCPSIIGKLEENCGHTELKSGIGNFIIKVEGAVVQADAFANPLAAADDLISLF